MVLIGNTMLKNSNLMLSAFLSLFIFTMCGKEETTEQESYPTNNVKTRSLELVSPEKGKTIWRKCDYSL
jgi:hypothetical protein